ncbi:E3 ubiquitin-protein ligase rad18 [Perkinsus chesapeaki]|uniref:RING-type E3 ubiquitin transferase n=1 Tax=Perkinsus chesapeaki TaxID=330153 RepID=A0A7J6N0Z1_PERCH|nr:E3 ubiquitin-protein ligase rad18 [Perkinsus chesapeaki]
MYPRRSARLEVKVEQREEDSLEFSRPGAKNTPQRARARAVRTSPMATPRQKSVAVGTTPAELGKATPPRKRVGGEERAVANPELLNSFKEIEAQLRCPVCKGFLDAPMMAKCSHVFCSLCIRRHLELVSQTCPECNAHASVSSLVKEPRLATMAIRVADAAEVSSVKEGKNPVFIRQKLSQSQGTAITTRPTLPIFRGKKDREVQEMMRRDGLDVPYPWKRDDAIGDIKELQAAYDGRRMGALTQEPTRQGVLRAMQAEKGNPKTEMKSTEAKEQFEEARWHMLRMLQKGVQKARRKGSLKRKWVDDWDSSTIEHQEQLAAAAAKRARTDPPARATYPIFGIAATAQLRKPPDV